MDGYPKAAYKTMGIENRIEGSIKLKMGKGECQSIADTR